MNNLEKDKGTENQNGKKKYQLIIDQKQYKVETETITGSEIKALAGVDPTYGLWRDLPGPDDPLVEDNDVIDLTEHGVERFFTGKIQTTEG